jgi:hypothetical protein
LVEATIEHPGFFAKPELYKRKRASLNLGETQPDPPWLEKYIERAWEPSRKDLEPMRQALEEHAKTFGEVYGPIRHQYFAHRTKIDDQAIADLFEKAEIGMALEILRFVYALTESIQEMWWNATKPDLNSPVAFDAYVAKTHSSVEKLVRTLPNRS